MLKWKPGDRVRNLFDCRCVDAPMQEGHRLFIQAGEVGTLEHNASGNGFLVRFTDGKWAYFEPMIFERVIDVTPL